MEPHSDTRELRNLTALPEFNFFIFGALLNLPWEFMQVPLYADMANARHWDAVRICGRAALGDALILLIAYWAVASAGRDRWWFLDPRRWELGTFLAVGLATTIVLERLATMSALTAWGWRYSDLMPVIPGIAVGLAPLLQWMILPPLILWIVRRQVLGERATGAGQLRRGRRP